MAADPHDRLSSTLAALADPTRRALVARLAEGDATVTELAAPHAMSLAAVSKHLKVLEGAGLISRGRAAQFRPCHLEGAPLKHAVDWLESYRHFWDASLDTLALHLRAVQASASSQPPAKTKKKAPARRRSAP
jgi:DNA-binding transcriptional ArsR family regulator